MKSAFSEFSYGFALTQQVISDFGPLSAAPFFPSLIQEGQPGFGFDVALTTPGYLVFLQFKLSEYMSRQSARESGYLAVPYYRFKIMPSYRSPQHAMLLDLASAAQNVFYAAPAFHLQSQFNQAYLNQQMIPRSRLVSPLAIGTLDDGDHTVCFNNAVSGVVCSEPKEISFFSLRGDKHKLLGGTPLLAQLPHVTEVLYTTITRHVNAEISKGPIGGLDNQPVTQLKYVSYIATTFLQAHVVFIPTI